MYWEFHVEVWRDVTEDGGGQRAEMKDVLCEGWKGRKTHGSATGVGLVTLFARLCKSWCQGLRIESIGVARSSSSSHVTCHLHSHRAVALPDLAAAAARPEEDTAAAAVRRSLRLPTLRLAPLRASRPTTPAVSLLVTLFSSSNDDVAQVG